MDNFYTGRRTNIAHLTTNPLFEILRHDICLPLYVEVDMTYNLAYPASPIHYQSDPVQTTKTSVHGAINMLGLAKRIKAKILQASTSEVYGDPAIHPQDETYWGNVNPVGLRSCYDDITGPINLGNTREFSILELATKIIELSVQIQNNLSTFA